MVYTIMNIGSGQARSNSLLIGEMIALGIRPSYEHVTGPDTLDYSWADIGLAEELLNFHPATDLNLQT